MNEVVSTDDAPRRIWTDPFFFAIIGAIAASYVFLIIAMLGADALYLFRDQPEIDEHGHDESFDFFKFLIFFGNPSILAGC